MSAMEFKRHQREKRAKLTESLVVPEQNATEHSGRDGSGPRKLNAFGLEISRTSDALLSMRAHEGDAEAASQGKKAFDIFASLSSITDATASHGNLLRRSASVPVHGTNRQGMSGGPFSTFRPAKMGGLLPSSPVVEETNQCNVDFDTTSGAARDDTTTSVALSQLDTFLRSLVKGKRGSSSTNTGGFERSGQGLSAQLADGGSDKNKLVDIPESAYVPLAGCQVDFSLKRRVRFLCAGPLASFEWTKYATRRDKRGREFLQAIEYAVHPGKETPPLKTNGGFVPDALREFFVTRQRDWEEAFSGLFSMYMDKTSEDEVHFYLQCGSFTVLFAQNGSTDDGVRDYRAIISPSSRSFRASLQKHDIPFAMPHVPGGAIDHLDEEVDVLQELKLLQETGETSGSRGQTRLRRRSSKDMSGAKSTLHVTGEWAVHGLFDFLLNVRFEKVGVHIFDLPTLLCSRPFKHATVRSLEIVRNAETFVGGKEYHALELEGPVLPLAVGALVRLFSTTQFPTSDEDADCQSTMDVDFHVVEETRSFNVPWLSDTDKALEAPLSGGYVESLKVKRRHATKEPSEAVVCHQEIRKIVALVKLG